MTVYRWLAAGHLDTAVLVPFAAGNFIYIALANLVPEMTTTPAAHNKAIHTIGFTAGLALLYTDTGRSVLSGRVTR